MKVRLIKDALLASIYLKEKQSVLSGGGASEFRKTLDKCANRIAENYKTRKKTRFSPTNCMLADFLNKRIEVLADVIESTDLETITFLESDLELLARASHQATLKNRRRIFGVPSVISEGQVIPIAAIADEKLLRKIHSFHGKRTKILGTVVSIPSGRFRSTPHLFIDKVKECSSLVEFLNPSKDQLEKAEKILFEQKDIMLKFITSQMVKALNVVIPESSNHLNMIECAIVSCCAQSYHRGKNGRIHIGTFSSPGAGKNIQESTVRMLSPNYYHITGSKLTLAGLIGSSTLDQKTLKRKTDKGYLPLAHNGSVYLEDIHAIPDSKRSEIFGVLSEQMENGYINDSTSAKRRYEAAAGVILGWNLKSQVDKSKQFNAYQALPLPLNILSRLDVIIELDGSVARDSSHLRQFIKANLQPNRSSCEFDEGFILKVVIALLIDKTKSVSLKDVGTYITDKVELFFAANLHLDGTDEYMSIQGRMVNSIGKLATAHARLHQRSLANIEDADFALEVIRLKLNSLHRILPYVKRSKLTNAPSEVRKRRQRWILENFGGKEVTISELITRWNEEFNNQVSERTFRRELNDGIAKTTGTGKWAIKVD